MVLADFTNFERDTCYKLSSTAAFKTLTSSPHQPMMTDSPKSENIYRPIEEQKTVKRSNRSGINPIKNVKVPKLMSLEPSLEHHPSRLRKETKQNQIALDEGHAEPFEIIENSDYNAQLKQLSFNKEKQNHEYTPTSVAFEIEKTEKKVQTSSFHESDFYHPQRESLPSQSMRSDLVKFKNFSDTGKQSSLNSQRVLSNYSLAQQLKNRQVLRKPKTNFITSNIRNISNFRKDKKSKRGNNQVIKRQQRQKVKYAPSQTQNLKVRTSKSREKYPKYMTKTVESVKSQRGLPQSQLEL